MLVCVMTMSAGVEFGVLENPIWWDNSLIFNKF